MYISNVSLHVDVLDLFIVNSMSTPTTSGVIMLTLFKQNKNFSLKVHGFCVVTSLNLPVHNIRGGTTGAVNKSA